MNGTLNTDHEGYCCNEMDILEANSQANAFTPHPCENGGCDKSGCGYNPYARGDTSYYGPGMTVDTSKPFTVVTQFVTDDGTAAGSLANITRHYIQDGRRLPSADPSGDTILASACSSAQPYGGLAEMGEALGRGMVLVFSIWNDPGGYMNWLDSGSAGPCSSTAGNPADIVAQDPGTHVVFSNIRWGDIGSTTGATSSGGGGDGGGGGNGGSPTTPTAPAGPAQTRWGQCGGQGWTGAAACASPYTCHAQNPYYSQCL